MSHVRATSHGLTWEVGEYTGGFCSFLLKIPEIIDSVWPHKGLSTLALEMGWTCLLHLKTKYSDGGVIQFAKENTQNSHQ